MKSTFHILFALLLSSLPIRASPIETQNDALVIPIEKIVRNDMGDYSDHPLFPKFEQWISSSPSLENLRNNDTLSHHPNLKSIQCDNDHSGCLLASTFYFPGITPAENGPLVKRANAGELVSSTHMKTYVKEDEGNGGHEHYFSWNLRCGRVDYRSTGFHFKDSSVKAYGSNDIATWVSAYHYEDHRHEVMTMQQNFACAFYRNKCCGSYNTASVTSATLQRWTWECNKSETASACQG